MDSATSFIEEIDYSELEFREVVGKGAFGVVSRALWRGKDVAVKKIETESEKKAFVQELKQLSRVSHPNIVRLYGACREQPVCLVMEYAEGGSLYNVLHCSNPQPRYTVAHSISWMLQCARGVEYLHNMKPKALVHRDLKPPNLLLIQFGTVLKICDFGTACDKQTHMTNNKGSAAWMAPEVFEGNSYTERCDVFSWGIILWEVLTRRKPFEEVGGGAFRIMWAVHSGTRPPLISGLPKPLEHLMTNCWSRTPGERPSMTEVVRIMTLWSQFLPGGDQPLTIPRNSGLDDDEEFETSYSRRNPPTTTSNNYNNMASPPIGTIRDTVRNNQEISDKSSPFFRHHATKSTSPVVIEEDRQPKNQMSAPPSLAASRECLNDSRSRSGTPVVDSAKRYSIDLSQLDENEQIQPSPHKVLGHRRSGSHGTTPNYLSTGSPASSSAAYYRGYTHRRTGSDEYARVSPGMASSPVLSTLTHEHMPSKMTHCSTSPGELSHSANFRPSISPARSISYHPQHQPESLFYSPVSASEQHRQSHGHDFRTLDARYNHECAFGLEPHLQPLTPYPNSEESMQIFEQHCQLAQEFMRIQAEIAVLTQRKNKLTKEMEHGITRSYEIEEYTRLSSENESLMAVHSDLKRKVEHFRKAVHKPYGIP